MVLPASLIPPEVSCDKLPPSIPALEVESVIATNPSQPHVVRFGVFEVDLTAGEVRKSGLRQKLTGQPFQLLQALLERPGEILTRDELRQRIWPENTFVDHELALKKAVNRVREVLGDSAESPRFIETSPRRGYRFIGVLSAFPSASPDRPGPVAAVDPPSVHVASPWISIGKSGKLIAGLAFITIAPILIWSNWDRLRTRIFARSPSPEIHSLAVLPLQNLSTNPGDEYFSEGITESLTTDLAQIGALRVISRTSAEHFKGSRETLPEIARQLNVEAVVEGSVTR